MAVSEWVGANVCLGMCRWTQVILRRNRKSCLVVFVSLREVSFILLFWCSCGDFCFARYHDNQVWIKCVLYASWLAEHTFFFAYIHNFEIERKSSLKAVLVYFSSKQHSVLLTQCTMGVNKPHQNLSKSAACGRDLRRGVFWRLSPAYKFFSASVFFPAWALQELSGLFTERSSVPFPALTESDRCQREFHVFPSTCAVCFAIAWKGWHISAAEGEEIRLTYFSTVQIL